MDSLSYYNNQYMPIQQPWMQNVSNSSYLGTTAPAYTGTMSCFPNETIFNSTWTPNFYSSTGISNIPLLGTTTSSSSSSSSSSATADEPMTIEQYDAMKAERRRQKAKEKEQKAINEGKVILTSSERAALRKERLKRVETAAKEMRPGVLGLVGGSLVFASGTIIRGAQVKKNEPITRMFYEEGATAGTAKHQQLFNDTPLTMRDAQEEMAKANRKYQRALRRAKRKGFKTTSLTSDYNAMCKMMKDALATGNADEVAKATAQVKAANGAKYKFNAKGNVTRKLRIAQNADISKAKPIKGNGFMKHLGGGLGATIGILSAGIYVWQDWGKIKEAGKISEEAKRKQIGQTAARAAGSVLSYTICDGLARKATTKILAKSAGKIAAKLAAKGAGKALGAAIGSIAPGVGTIIGLLVGAGIDLLLSKVVIPKLFGEADAVEYAKNDAMSNEELLAEAYFTKAQGGEISQIEQRLLDKNPTFCGLMKAELDRQKAEQQAAQTGVV